MDFREWIARAEPLAYGELRLLPWEFEVLTPHEFFLRAEGAERVWQRAARLVSWIAQPSYKGALTPETILHGRPRPPR